MRASAKFRVLLLVHRSGDWGSPRVAGLTRASRSARRVSSRWTSRFRPPPGRRTRGPLAGSFGSHWEERLSAMPIRTVFRDRPVASATALIPPQPRAKASLAAQRRRSFSSMIGDRDRYFSRTVAIALAVAIVPFYRASQIYQVILEQLLTASVSR